MWPISEPSYETATRLSDIANLFLIGSLVAGVISTFVIVKIGNIKEGYWDHERQQSRERIAQLNNETIRLRENALSTNDSLLATLHTGRANSLAVEANRYTTEALAVSQGSVKREATSEGTRALYIVTKVAPFAGKTFDAIVTSTDIILGGLMGSLKSALKTAGWIEIEQSDPTAGVCGKDFPQLVCCRVPSSLWVSGRKSVADCA
jgi:hypothetical protein